MPFHFKGKESVSKGLRRICCERIDDALESLDVREPLKSVHDVRKEIKKLRATMRLVRDEIGKIFYDKSNGQFRRAACCLTELRDAHVKLSAFEELVKHFKLKLPARSFPKIKSALRENCRAEEKKFLKSGSVAVVQRILKKSRRQIKDLKIKSDGWRAICPGLKKSFGRARAARETALAKSSPENFHEWRKRVKDLWYQIRISCPVWPEELGGVADELERLGEFLGDDHDLFMLAEFLETKFKRAGEINNLQKLICVRQKELRSAALDLGARFFAEKPKAFCTRLESYWKIWREEK